MQKPRSFGFFDRQVVKEEGLDIHRGVQQLNVACAGGGSHSLWLGSASGEVRRLNKQYVLSQPWQLFEHELLELKVLDQRQLLVVIGTDGGNRAEKTGAMKYKVYNIRGNEEPALLSSNKLLPPRMVEQVATCFDVSTSAHLMAVGGDTGFLVLLRAKDLAKDRPSIQELAAEGSDGPISSTHFLEQSRRTVVFACTLKSVRSWSCDDGCKLLNIDTSGGSARACSCVFPASNSLLAARGEGIFAHDPEEGNMSAIPVEGEKMTLVRYKSYFVVVTAESTGSQALGSGSVAKQTVAVWLLYPQMRFIAYSAPFTDVTHVFSGMGNLYVISHGSAADSNTVIFELKEKEMSDQIGILVNERMFEWAAAVGLRDSASSETVADIYRQHGDALFDKQSYDQALAVYGKTIELGLPLEPSYIVEKYLDAQRIGHVAKYLKKLHEHNMAEREHTALLLKCYTKLRDLSTLQDFLSTVSPLQYDAAVAIDVLETAGYYVLAADVAKRVGRHDDVIRISISHFNDHTQILEFIAALEAEDASAKLVQHGRILMRHVPKETAALAAQLCEKWCSSNATSPSPPSDGRVGQVEEFLGIFVDNEAMMEDFLRAMVLGTDGTPVLRPTDCQRLVPALLELMLRKLKVESSDDVQASLQKDSMNLIKQYSSEDCLVNTLMLCQTYSFVDGLFYTAKKLGRFQLLMTWCFTHRDVVRLVEVCKECGDTDPSLWVQTLSFIAAEEGDHIEELKQVLDHIEQSDLVPFLEVIETLQQNPRISLDVLRPYLIGQFEKLGSSLESSRTKAQEDRKEILQMQQEIVSLQTTAQVFQSTRCFQCKLTLEVPAVHFFCGHSYHAYCLPVDGRCPKCSLDALEKMSRKEQYEAKAMNADEFLKQLQSSIGESGMQVVGEWCRLGAFDAALAVPQDDAM